ncbi:MAG: cob(I)alamin adenosyltransferase [Parcubacteria group bacterium Gr01-1014_2]|nr:MAG: cob(I)alamin adenosyltransferase [Parcubacteria group bacterium Gr01-1014_2]
MIIIFTGNGKGKTTASLGQAMRSLGEGKKAIMIQFVKGPWISGEDNFIKKFKTQILNFQIIKGGKGFVGIMDDRLPRATHKKAAKETLELAQKIILSKKYDLIILDEVNVAVGLKLISEKDVLKVLKMAPQGIDVILTGRNAPKKFIDLADIATEMKEIKYKFRPTKTGIEY